MKANEVTKSDIIYNANGQTIEDEVGGSEFSDSDIRSNKPIYPDIRHAKLSYCPWPLSL